MSAINTETKPRLLKTVCGLEVWFYAEKELEPCKDHFINFCGWSLEDYKNMVQSNPKWFCAVVEIRKAGEILSTQYLGGCLYQNVSEFYTKYSDDYLAYMIEEGIQEAEQTLVDVISTYTEKLNSLTA